MCVFEWVSTRCGGHVVHKVWWTLACKKGVSRGRLRHEVVGVQLRAGRDFRRCANDGNSVKNPNVIRSVFVRFPPCTGCCARCGRTNVRVCILHTTLSLSSPCSCGVRVSVGSRQSVGWVCGWCAGRTGALRTCASVLPSAASHGQRVHGELW